MTKRHAARAIGRAICGVVLAAGAAAAQFVPPAAKPPDGAALFRQQCATCHTLSLSEPDRQGPSLHKILGRPAGKAGGFQYSSGLASANFVWDEAQLDAWLTNPQAVFPDAFMAYRQSKAETRAAIIAYLKELN
jgi:cytochrome c